MRTPYIVYIFKAFQQFKIILNVKLKYHKAYFYLMKINNVLFLNKKLNMANSQSSQSIVFVKLFPLKIGQCYVNLTTKSR